MTYKHGVYISEVPTSILPPVRTSAGLPVVFGTAPIHLSADGVGKVNEPVLAFTYKEAVDALGFHSDFDKFTLCEAMEVFFSRYAVGPVVLVNVMNPADTDHRTAVTEEAKTLVAGLTTLTNQHVYPGTIVVKSDDGLTTYDIVDDYVVTMDEDGYATIERTATSAIPTATTALKIDYHYLLPAAVVAADVIGGVVSGANTGLELVNDIFPRFRLVPGQILAPKFSTDAGVAAVMVAKASNINNHFKAIALADIPTDASTGADLYTEAPTWKETNNYTDGALIPCWPKVKLSDSVYHLSTIVAAVNMLVDSQNDDVPYQSPSNQVARMNSAIVESGAEVWLGPDQAAYLNGQGIVTALNFIGGWKVWGNRTGIYPGSTDVKDAFIPIRRMFNWIGNELVLTFWQKVDSPLNRRLVETVLDSYNIRLNGLAARGFINGGRVEFQPEENPETDLIDGIVRFHVYVTPPGPAREIDFVLEYDPSYLQSLFS